MPSNERTVFDDEFLDVLQRLTGADRIFVLVDPMTSHVHFHVFALDRERTVVVSELELASVRATPMVFLVSRLRPIVLYLRQMAALVDFSMRECPILDPNVAAAQRELNQAMRLALESLPGLDPRLVLAHYASPEEAAMLHAVTLDPPEVDFINRAWS